MKRTSILLLILLALLACWYFLSKAQDNATGISVEDRAFAIENTDEISKVVIVSKRQAPVVLSKENKAWFVDTEQGKKRARKNTLKNLMQVISGLQIKYIPPSQARKNILDEMALIGVKVQIYNAANELIKSYTVGGAPSDELGTYFLMDGAHQPYVMHLPSLEGSVRGRYEMKNIDWRDRTVFAYDTRNIRKVSIVYPKLKSESFTLEQGDTYVLTSLDPYIQDPINHVNQQVAKAYVEGFDKLVAEYIENTNPLRDSLDGYTPFALIEITDADGVINKMDLYPVDDFIFEEEVTNMGDNMRTERYFADCSSGDFVLIQHRLIKKILRGYSFFRSDEHEK